MRSPDFIAMMLAMLAVPMASWLVGRFTGRRNAGVALMLLLSLAVTGLVQVGLLLDYGGFGQPARPGQRDAIIGGLEFSAFLFVLGIFVTLLGWSATPARITRPS